MGVEVVETDFRCPSEEAVEKAVEVIKSGGVVVIPTDTVYGIAADPFNEDALERVFRVKERSLDSPVPLLLGESHHYALLARGAEALVRLALRFWPGPLTVVLEPLPDAPRLFRRWGQVGVRLPACPICREIARRVGGIITGTSANISGRESPRTAQQAMFQLGNRVDLYIDAGPTPLGRSSTVVDVRGGEPRLVREGPIPFEDILEALKG